LRERKTFEKEGKLLKIIVKKGKRREKNIQFD